MCAINGIVDTRGRSKEEIVVAEALVRAMNAATMHRGPDATLVWRDAHATLGHNRLAVIDLSAEANQPMADASGRYVLVYNGEIYNFKELRKELASYPFKTQGDSEVILAAFSKWGVAAFPKLRGIFAFGLWDSEKKELYLVRDQVGTKPLYYRHDGFRLLFSSELLGIAADKDFARKMDHGAVANYLRLRYVPEPQTVYRGVHKVPAGHYVMFKGDQVSVQGYFSVPLLPLLKDSKKEIEARVRELVDRSVASELVSDRPLGLFLSGGLDSNIVLDAATRAGGPMDTFTMRFAVREDENPERFNADADLAAKSAKHYKTRHHEIQFSENEFLDLLPEAMHFLDQPIGNATAISQLFLARAARKHIVVALQGDGGDELFGGYPRYRISRFMDLYQKMPNVLRSIAGTFSSDARKLNLPPGIARIEQFMFEKDKLLAPVIAPGFLSSEPARRFDAKYLEGRESADFTQLFMDADRQSWLPEEALARTDAMTMAVALETRVPLLNADLVSYASRIRSSMRVGLFDTKKLLRESFAERLPEHILKAEKRGWFSPIAKWLRRPEVERLAREALSKGFHPGTDALFNWSGAQSLLEEHLSKRRYAAPLIWSLLTLRLWARDHDAHL